jgi:putative endonuclease
MSEKTIRQQRGAWGEDFACAYLEQQGLQLISRNYHSRYGEIDLIMQHQQILIFVEVRYRRSASHGSSAESVNSRKQQKIILTAQEYLQSLSEIPICRFDVLAIMGTMQSVTVDWIQDAFQG